MWGIFVLLVLTILGAAFLYFGVRTAVVDRVRTEMTPEEFAEMQEWLATKVEFPEDWRRPKPFSDELKETAEEIRPAVEYWLNPDESIREQLNSPKHPLILKLGNGETLSEEEWNQITALQTEAHPLLEAVSDFVAIPDYEFEAFSLLDYENQHASLNQKANLKLSSLIAWRLALEAYIHAQERDWSKAYEEALSILLLVKRHPATDSLNHLVGANIEIIASHTLGDLANRCDDAGLLRSILDQPDEARTGYPEQFIDSTFSLDTIVYLRKARRSGLQVDLRPGLPNSFYLRQFAQIMTSKKSSDTDLSARKGNNLVDLWPIELIYSEAKTNMEGITSRFQLALATIRLAEIRVARRIREIEKNETVSDLSDLVPELLSSSPEDPFSGNSFLWDASSEIFYSVGPDKKDDGNLVQYNPTNGWISVGDYSLR